MTDRCIPPSVECLRPFVDAGVLGMVEVHVVATLVGRFRSPTPIDTTGSNPIATDSMLTDPTVTDDVVLAAALAVRAPLHGHVRVDLDEVATTVVPFEATSATPVVLLDGGSDRLGDPSVHEDEGSELHLPLSGLAESATDDESTSSLPWPDPEGWPERVLASPLARAGADERGQDVAPLVVSGSTLYLDRWWCDEEAVARELRARAAATSSLPPYLTEVLDRFLPESADDEPDRQRAAVRTALERQLVVIAGGPGTGKTRTVARLLAVLVSGNGAPSPAVEHPVGTPSDVDEVEARQQPPAIALAAPTGKAAARLQEAIAAAVRDADPGAEVVERLRSLESRTIHRLLGARGHGAAFAHDATDPIPADVVVIDEVSMVSLPLMARLLDAIRPEARVVLVGDPFQLASVEAGAVLGDLVGRRAGAQPPALRDNVVVLDRVYRFGPESPVAGLAAAIKDGDADAVVAVLRSGGEVLRSGCAGRRPEEFLRWVDPASDDDVALVRSRVFEHATTLVDVARSTAAEEALSVLGRCKVLCATRRGPLGVDAWNRTVEAELRGGGRMRTRWSAGRPLMVTANDHVNGVFNGDVGVVVCLPGTGRGPAPVRVAFDGPDGPRLLAASRLDRVASQWAMTIHKSQGSEFDEVVVTLPPPPSPILTRELLYTAVTRARSGVTLVASEASVRTAVDRPVARSSGLAERLT